MDDTFFDHRWERAVATGRGRCAPGGVVRIVLDAVHLGTTREGPRVLPLEPAYFAPDGLLFVRAPKGATVEEVLFGEDNHLVDALDASLMVDLRLTWPEKRPGLGVALLVACRGRGGSVEVAMGGAVSAGPAPGPRVPTFFVPSPGSPSLRPRRLRMVPHG